MDGGDHLCSLCGGIQHELVAEGRLRCVECGQGSSFGTATLYQGETTPEALDKWTRLASESDRRLYEDVRRAPFPGHALDARWTGLRWLGGCSSSGEGVSAFALAHGDRPWDLAAPQVRVHTQIATPPIDLEVLWHSHTQQQVSELWHRTHKLPERIRRAAFPLSEQSVAADPTAPWDEAAIPIDEVPLAFRVLADGDHWVAQARQGDVLISISATGWPIERTGLVIVRDVGEYYQGSLEVNRRWAGAV